jgi:hypothetical protein
MIEHKQSLGYRPGRCSFADRAVSEQLPLRDATDAKEDLDVKAAAQAGELAVRGPGLLL